MLGRIYETLVCLALQNTAALQRVVFHVAKQLVGKELKEPWSFTVAKVSAVGFCVFSEDGSIEVNGVDSVEIVNFKVLKNTGFQPYLCISVWNGSRRWDVRRQLEEEEMFGGN